MIPEAVIAALIAVGSFLAGLAWEITRSNQSIRGRENDARRHAGVRRNAPAGAVRRLGGLVMKDWRQYKAATEGGARHIPERRQQVQPPAVPDRAAIDDTSGIIATLFTIEPVSLVVVFDSEPDTVRLENPRSSALFELLNRANMERGTVIACEIRGRAVSGAALARLNWFLHVHGYTRGFRGWKRARQRSDAGMTLWRSAPAWVEFKTQLRL